MTSFEWVMANSFIEERNDVINLDLEEQERILISQMKVDFGTALAGSILWIILKRASEEGAVNVDC